ncbi:MAG: Rieske 2Fe-2S domain-containing protein [Alphaproteobacteria bacterium]
MTAQQDSEDLTRVGAGTVMGDFMRQYWIPAAKSDELAADGDPMRLMLLGEKLIAFRDTNGRVGVMDHRCPHRCASLFLGRNEEGGIRCVYHGWKFDAAGNCIDMPNLRPEQDFRHKVHAKAYRVAERNGLVWVYMGAREQAPPLPAMESTLVPEGEVGINFVMRDCNWMQALEGDIDTSHFGFLHVGHVGPDDVPEDHPFNQTVNDRAPRFDVADTPWGASYGAWRQCAPGRNYWRISNFIFPFWTQTPQGAFDSHVHVRAWVPLDDTHTMFIYVYWKAGSSGGNRERPPLRNGKLGAPRAQHEYLPNTTDWLGRWRITGNESNDWQIDRALQRSGALFTGIANIHQQDQAVTESMGPLTDHAFEHLAPSDLMITRTRRRCLLAARAFRATGEAPPGVDDPESFFAVRSGYFEEDESVKFAQAYASHLETVCRAVNPPSAEAAD